LATYAEARRLQPGCSEHDRTVLVTETSPLDAYHDTKRARTRLSQREVNRRDLLGYRFHGIVRPPKHGKNHGVEQRKGGGVDLRSFMYDETGQGLIEYALIIAVIAVAVIVAMLFLRDQLTNVFSNVGNNLT
jgi:pilus assembly protein Flp/PilA